MLNLLIQEFLFSPLRLEKLFKIARKHGQVLLNRLFELLGNQISKLKSRHRALKGIIARTVAHQIESNICGRSINFKSRLVQNKFINFHRLNFRLARKSTILIIIARAHFPCRIHWALSLDRLFLRSGFAKIY